MKNLLIGIGIAILLGACKSTPVVEPVKVDPPTTSSGATTSGTTNPGNTGVLPTPVVPVGKTDDLKDPKSILATRVIYFDYNTDAVKAEFAALIQAHAAYLAKNPGRKIRLEGHADERGSREYNMALGQRRANAVRKATSVLGVADSRVETISFGEDKPKNTGHDEAAWSQNRRVEIVYDGE